MDHTYCINWQMKLGEDKDNPCSSKRFGFFRVGLVTQLPKEARNLEQLSLYSGEQTLFLYNSSAAMWSKCCLHSLCHLLVLLRRSCSKQCGHRKDCGSVIMARKDCSYTPDRDIRCFYPCEIFLSHIPMHTRSSDPYVSSLSEKSVPHRYQCEISVTNTR